MHGVINAVFLLFHFNFGRTTDTDHGNTASQLGQTLLQFLTVVIRGGVFDLLLDLANAGFDVGFLASTVNDGGLVLGNADFLGGAEHVEGDILELDAEVFGNQLTIGQDRHVFHHRLATITEARSLDGSNLEAATQLVDHEGSKCFAFNVFSDDQQRTAGLNNSFEDWQHGLQVREFFLVIQDEWIFQLANHLVSIGDEVWREIATVELHAFNDFEFGFQ